MLTDQTEAQVVCITEVAAKAPKTAAEVESSSSVTVKDESSSCYQLQLFKVLLLPESGERKKIW